MESISKPVTPVLLRNNLLLSALIFVLLECWRPYFFLTDDNLDGTFPFFVEVGQNPPRGPLAFYFASSFRRRL